MKFNDLPFVPIILGSDITAYSLARSFHEEYGIKSITLSMSQKGYVADSSFIENRYFPGLEKDEEAVKRLLEVGKEFAGKKKLILCGIDRHDKAAVAGFLNVGIVSRNQQETVLIIPAGCTNSVNKKLVNSGGFLKALIL